MKNLIVLLLAFFMLTSSKSIAQDSPDSKGKEVYCQIVGYGKLLSKKVTVTIDTGDEESSKLFKSNFLKDDDGKPIVFNTMIGALNYMSSKDWEFVQAYTITVGNQNIYHYLMKRKE